MFGASAALPAGREGCCESGWELGMEQVSPDPCPSAFLVPLLLCSATPEHHELLGSPSWVEQTKPGTFVGCGSIVYASKKYLYHI